jgi:A/G-specific adenine glycosylase
MPTKATKKTRALPMPPPPDRRRFRQRLLTWYRTHGRDLPWRKTDDPYHILVSEIMLQQTQVDRVLPKYAEWLAKFPTMEVLAKASDGDVNEAWYPLGYNIRPRRLQSIARESVERYGGKLPRDEETLLSFKGIGAYTAGAIRSFAFRERAAILDTNVARVLFRVFVGRGEPKSHAMTQHLWKVAEQMVPPQRHAFDFNQALMDLGALVCTAKSPKCLVCPMSKGCVWRQSSLQQP